MVGAKADLQNFKVGYLLSPHDTSEVGFRDLKVLFPRAGQSENIISMLSRYDTIYNLKF